MSVLHFLWDLLYFLTGEDTWQLRDHEWLVLVAAIANFKSDIQDATDICSSINTL